VSYRIEFYDKNDSTLREVHTADTWPEFLAILGDVRPFGKDTCVVARGDDPTSPLISEAT
jgi:hypothetical protein